MKHDSSTAAVSEPSSDETLGDLGQSRRHFLKASGGLVLGFSLMGSGVAWAAESIATGKTNKNAAAQLDAWLAVHPDNTVTLFTGKVEVGNGNETSLAQIAAEELYFPVDQLIVVMGSTDKTIDQGPTYGSRTIPYAGPQIRHAAAAGRQALLSLGAKHFKLPAHQLATQNGSVSVIGDPAKKISYGELVDGHRFDVEIGASGNSFGLEIAPDTTLKNQTHYSIVGKSVPRKDIPGKMFAQYSYIQDIKVDGMLHGRVVRPYGVGAKLVDVDESGLKDIPGFVQVVREGNFLGVVAKTEWAAIKAASRLGSTLHPKGRKAGQATWSDANTLPDQDKVWDTVRKTSGKDVSVASNGAYSMAANYAARTIKATYQTPFQMHASIGPSCAIADVNSERAIFWAGTQMPHQARRDMAKMLDVPEDKVTVHWHGASGAYGRNGLEHVIADAAVMSRAVGKPVRVQWMRWDEHGWEPKGPPIAQDLEGLIDEDGKVIGWRHHMWVPTTGNTNLIAADLIGHPVGDEGAGRGSISYAYTFQNADVSYHGEGRVGVITAWLRSPAQFETTFAMEAFIDELAADGQIDPLTFRLQNLEDARAIGVLQAAAEKYGWTTRASNQDKAEEKDGQAIGRGIAWVNRDDSYVATIADIVVDRESGQITVKRVVVAHDCGLVVNPDALKNQIEGNIIQSLSRTLHEEVTFDNAHITSRDWVGYPILRFNEIPDSIEMVFVNDTPGRKMTGGGEPSTCPTAAVVSNALYDAIGVRMRQTPFRADRVKKAMA
ncbi:xanthine dehydrogenase family protein molybdopterin-binding subunit [Salinisphaera aquimarina]|uniref:Molybdopterin cofactor-binding domain-containing protein n=1 Tax=Salinisphaera aquimarina TaxID=2094031 RepID=A0ABV7EP97_9GAMM